MSLRTDRRDPIIVIGRSTDMASKIETGTKRTAVITGGSRGMGRNTALNLARRGVDVIFTYHSNQTEAESLIREIDGMGGKAAAFRLNTGTLGAFDGFVADVRKALASWGR